MVIRALRNALALQLRNALRSDVYRPRRGGAPPRAGCGNLARCIRFPPTANSTKTMTQLLEQAMTEVQKLPERDQNVIASLIFEEMLDERKWDEAFANSQEIG